MSRSYKKTPIIGIGGYSDKKDKQQYNRSFRHLTRDAIRKEQFDMLPEREFNGQYGRNWNFNKDGKIYLTKTAILENPRLIEK